MKTYKDITIIEGHLGSFIYDYIKPLRLGIGFEHFSDETILYSLLEYSKFERFMDEDERLLYLYNKCNEFTGVNKEVTIEYDDNGNFIMIDNSSPF